MGQDFLDRQYDIPIYFLPIYFILPPPSTFHFSNDGFSKQYIMTDPRAKIDQTILLDSINHGL